MPPQQSARRPPFAGIARACGCTARCRGLMLWIDSIAPRGRKAVGGPSARRPHGFYPSRGAKWLVPRRRESLISAREQYKPFALIRTAFPSSRFLGPSKKSVLHAPRRLFPEDFDAGMEAFWSFSTGCQGSISTCRRPEDRRPGPFPPWAFRPPARRRSATRWPRWRRFAGPSG